MPLIALTGNYGMGKSTVLSMFAKLGVDTVDADIIVESLLKEEEILEKIKQLLGDKVFNKDGSLNKKKVADIVFKDNSLRHSLEDILHPPVFEKIKEFSNKIGTKDKILIVAAPLIFERGYEERFERTIVVYTREDVSLNRLKKNGISREEVLIRLKAQLPIEEKMRKADFVIDNNGTAEETMAEVETIYKKLITEARDGNTQRT
jgi:dephospho-CoA kinase